MSEEERDDEPRTLEEALASLPKERRDRLIIIENKDAGDARS